MSAAADDELPAGAEDGDRPPGWISSERHTAWAYDLIADRYADVWFDRPSTPLADAFLAHLPVGALVLDAGCGPGQYTRYFWSRDRFAVGIDISAHTIANARARCGLPVFARMSMTALAFPDAAFTGIWACASVPHIPRASVGRALAQFHRVLKPSGVLFVNVPLGSGSRIETPAEFGSAGSYGRFFQRYPDPDSFCAVLRTHGFDVVDRWADVVHSEVLANRGTISVDWLNVIARKRGAPG